MASTLERRCQDRHGPGAELLCWLFTFMPFLTEGEFVTAVFRVGSASWATDVGVSGGVSSCGPCVCLFWWSSGRVELYVLGGLATLRLSSSVYLPWVSSQPKGNTG